MRELQGERLIERNYFLYKWERLATIMIVVFVVDTSPSMAAAAANSSCGDKGGVTGKHIFFMLNMLKYVISTTNTLLKFSFFLFYSREGYIQT